MMINLLKKIKRKLIKPKTVTSENLIGKYLNNGQIPWSEGYQEYKIKSIKEAIDNLSIFGKDLLPEDYGFRLDERIVEYPWSLYNLSDTKTKMFDAGSVFNYDFIVNHPKLKEKELYIQTFYPENNCFWKKRISYVFEDLRNIPFKNNFFDEIVCISTLEHIDMDNSMYGYTVNNKGNDVEKSYEYINVITELVRILNSNGKLLITFPFGVFENHGFFQQFDEEMLNKITDYLKKYGKEEIIFFKYLEKGWIKSRQSECTSAKSYNPHTQIGKGQDGAAHSRAICCIQFTKS